MMVKDLRPKCRVDNIELRVKKLLGDRLVKPKFSREEKRVQEYRMEDDSGEVNLVLWGPECRLLSPENIVRITDGYAKPDANGIKLTIGKYGKMEVVS